MDQVNLFGPGSEDWPIDENGNKLSLEEFTMAVYVLQKQGFLDIHFEQDGSTTISPTPLGVAARMVEDAMEHVTVQWPDESIN